MKKYKTVITNFAKCFATLMLAMIFGSNLMPLANAQSDQANDTSLVQVETKYVCMINNERFDKEQIAIEVGGQTYYGCCEMCKDKLKQDPKSRTAIDPVSGKKVDKAKAIIGANAEGNVFYFENVDNVKSYKADSSSQTKQKGAHKH
jgi:YHS domain-containing protein